MKKKVTSKDIAQYANVSQATVSYVLNNTPGKSISEDTRNRVLNAVAELNYIPNNAARRLKNGRSYCIAVRLGTNLGTPRYYNALQGIRSYLEPKGYNILLCSDQKNGNALNYIDTCMNTQTDGIIYISSNHSDIAEDELKQIKNYKIPISAIDCMTEDASISSITYDYFASSYLRMDYFLKKGFKKFVYIRPKYINAKETARELGFRTVMMEHRDFSFDILQIDSIDINLSLFSKGDVPTIYSDYKHLGLKKIVDSVSLDTCFLCSSREVQQAISQKLFEQHLILQTKETERWFERSVSYHFPHFDAGYEAARSLLNIIDEKHGVRKLMLQPIIEPTDPVAF